MTANTAIYSRALLVWLTISTWSARKYDKKVSADVNAQYAASSDAGRYNKSLLPGDAPAYKELVQLAGSIRSWHYNETLSWSDEGWRLLPTANYQRYTTEFRAKQRAFETALQAFCADYPTMRAHASYKLGTLYKPEDYPSTADIRERFAIDVKYTPVPATGDIRVDLASDQINAIEQSINDRVAQATRTAVDDAWQRLHTVVAHIAERLGDPKSIFRDSLIGNAREVCDVLKRLNITDDPQLEAMRARVERELSIHDPDVLRDSPIVRARTAERAQQIVDQMSGFFPAKVA